MAPRRVDTSDMEKSKVDLRLNLERHRRRFNDAQQQHTFEEIVRTCLSRNKEGQPADEEENFVAIKGVDFDGSRQLRKYLSYVMSHCSGQDQFDLFHQTIRASLEDSMRMVAERSHLESKGFLKPPVAFCFCCGRDFSSAGLVESCARCGAQAIELAADYHVDQHQQPQNGQQQQQQDYQMPPSSDEPHRSLESSQQIRQQDASHLQDHQQQQQQSQQQQQQQQPRDESQDEDIDIGDNNSLLNCSAASIRAHEPAVNVHEELNVSVNQQEPLTPPLPPPGGLNTSRRSSDTTLDGRSSPELDPHNMHLYRPSIRFVPESLTPPLSAAPTPDIGGPSPLHRPPVPGSAGAALMASSQPNRVVTYSPSHHILITSTPNGNRPSKRPSNGASGGHLAKILPSSLASGSSSGATTTSSSPACLVGPKRGRTRKSRILKQQAVSKKELFTQ